MLETPADRQPQQPRHSTGAWWRVLLTALGLYVLGVVLLFLTQNPNLFPTIVLLGSFMVPGSYVAFFYERRHLSRLTMPMTARSFVYGGLLGVFAASFLEPLFIGGFDLPSLAVVGLIEEFAKILAVMILARGLVHNVELDGIILGAAAGMGFAALESMGYAFTEFLRSGGSLSAVVVITLVRGILSPVGHGTWTAILAGVLYRDSRPHRFRLTGAVIGAYLTVAILHSLWDGVPAVLGSFGLSGLEYLIGEGLVGAAGLAILWWRWREAVRLEPAEMATGEEGEKPDTPAGS